MIDWISGSIEAAGMPAGSRLYDTGHVLQIDRNGEIKKHFSAAELVEGSHDSRLLVKSPRGNDLYISGNIVKHIQGHNLFGHSDPVDLFFDAGRRIREEIGQFPSPGTWGSLEFSGPRFTRIDLTRSYRFPTSEHARAWLRDVAGNSRSRYSGALMTGETVYINKNSTRWAFKFYHKADELKAKSRFHKITSFFGNEKKLLEEWAQGVVRFELTLRTKELEKWDISALTPLQLWEEYYNRITMNQNARLVMSDLLEQQLTPTLQGVLAMWRQGNDLRSVFSKSAFYRHRKALLDDLGIDIAVKPQEVPAPTETTADLDPLGWDPEPIEKYLYRPDPDLKLSFPTKRKSAKV